jgi:hypothetical protein
MGGLAMPSLARLKLGFQLAPMAGSEGPVVVPNMPGFMILAGDDRRQQSKPDDYDKNVAKIHGPLRSVFDRPYFTLSTSVGSTPTIDFNSFGLSSA